MSKCKTLLAFYCPTIYEAISKSKINWDKLDQTYEKTYLKPGDNQSNLPGILLKAELGDSFCKDFLGLCEYLFLTLQPKSGELAKFRNIIVGKFTNLESLNYLNPIGELAVLKKFIDSGFTLERIEDKLNFPNATPKDFYLRHPFSGKKMVLEVVNIHLSKNYSSLKSLKEFLSSKLTLKIDKETKGIENDEGKGILFFLPVIWIFDFEKYKKFSNFFERFSKSFGNEVCFNYNVLGFCTLGRANQTFHFGEISTFYNPEKYK